jgi:hypothetical protein
MLVALNKIAAQQAAPTAETVTKTKMLLDYAATNPEATVRYHASDMCLHIDSDAAYLVQPKGHSRAAGHFYLSNKPSPTPATPTPPPNGPIHTECTTIRPVMSSAAEAEAGTIFINGQRAVPMQNELSELNHPQPPTPIKTDSATSHRILTGNMRRKKSKAFDMRFHWMKDRILQGQFNLYWMRGKDNLADYFTKHFPPLHHKLMRYRYLQRPATRTVPITQSPVHGCVTTKASRGHSTLSTDVTNGRYNNGHMMNNIHNYNS